MFRSYSTLSATTLAVAVWLGAIALITSCSTTYLAPEAKVHRELKAVPFEGQNPTCVEIHLRNGHVLIQHGEKLVNCVRRVAGLRLTCVCLHNQKNGPSHAAYGKYVALGVSFHRRGMATRFRLISLLY